jgi:hypothetical protein
MFMVKFDAEADAPKSNTSPAHEVADRLIAAQRESGVAWEFLS